MIENDDQRLQVKGLKEIAQRHGRRVRHEGSVPYIPATGSGAEKVAKILQRANPPENLSPSDGSL